MVPSKPEDFTGSHPGFEGELKRIGALASARACEISKDGRTFVVTYTAPPCCRFYWASYPPHGVVIEPAPLPLRDTE